MGLKRLPCQRCPRGCNITSYCGVIDPSTGRELARNHVVYISVLKAEDRPLAHITPSKTILRIVLPGATTEIQGAWWSMLRYTRSLVFRELDVHALLERIKVFRPGTVLVDGGEPLVTDTVYDIAHTLRRQKEQHIVLVLKTTGIVSPDRLKKAVELFDAFIFEYIVHLIDEIELASVAIQNLKRLASHDTTLEIHIPVIRDDPTVISVVAKIARDHARRHAVHVIVHENVSDTFAERLRKLVAELRRDKLNVYLYPDTSFTLVDTLCPHCGTILVERRPWSIRVKARIKNGKPYCPSCGAEVRWLRLVPEASTPATARELVVW